MWCVFCLDTSLLFNLRLFYLWVLSGNGRHALFPTVGGKTRLLSQGLPFSPPHPRPSLLVESLRFFCGGGNVNRKDNLVSYCKKFSLCLVRFVGTWRTGRCLKKKLKMKEWNLVNSYREFILYSCRNLKLLQKCNVVLNYAETFYKSNVNRTFFIQK